MRWNYIFLGALRLPHLSEWHMQPTQLEPSIIYCLLHLLTEMCLQLEQRACPAWIPGRCQTRCGSTSSWALLRLPKYPEWHMQSLDMQPAAPADTEGACSWGRGRA